LRARAQARLRLRVHDRARARGRVLARTLLLSGALLAFCCSRVGRNAFGLGFVALA
jgi:hypothetical protein